MAIIFSPIDGHELNALYKPMPKNCFLILQDSDKTPQLSKKIENICCEELKKAGIGHIKASSIKGTKDYLNKIIDGIRGCGLAIIIFTHETPPNSMGNIFYEAGFCSLLGKEIITITTSEVGLPSDFKRTEVVFYNLEEENKFRKDLKMHFKQLEEQAVFYKDMGDIALESDELDYEMAFERFKQSYLLTGDKEVLEKINEIKEKLDGKIKNSKDEKDKLYHERKLKKEISKFLKLSNS